MSKHKRRGRSVRDSPGPADLLRDGAKTLPAQRAAGLSVADGGTAALLLSDWGKIPPGYTPIAKNPEVLMAVGRIADLVSSMPIHVMENAEGGDKRVMDGLARKLDITPNRWMTRKTLVAALVRTLLLDGNGNAVVTVSTTSDSGTDYIDELTLVSPGRVSFVPDTDRPGGIGSGYSVIIDGIPHNPGDVLHFVLNPDPYQPWHGTGFRVSLKSVVRSLSRESKTKDTFLEMKYQPTIIIKVDSTAEPMQSEAGRNALLEQYIDWSEAGKPWLIPAELMDVSSVKPLTLNDLALSDSVQLDRKSVAAILGVPPYLVGAGEYDRKEWNQFVSATLMPLVRGLEQELTRKLILSPRRYVRMNPWALYAYELEDLADIGANLYAHGLMTGNQVRNWLNLEPMEGLDELVMLENYIPADRLGDQKKLKDLKKELQKGDDT